ncbi:MAG: outer membrane beta-barrel protein [Chitinophagales bacterium]|nr:PorT family protein [Chitinophagales bacterium]MDW8393121.1 outer membrane beta-barrel protein [Chitinophagales bacterium]
MKRQFAYRLVVLIAICWFTSFESGAQSFWIGAGGAYNGTWLLNDNVNDQGPNLNPAATGAPSLGIMALYMANEIFGVSLEGQLSRIDQRFNGTDAGVDFEARTKTSWIDIPLLLFLRSKGGFYMEIGPQFSLLNKVTETAETTPSSPLAYTDKDFTDNFKSNQISGVFGLGGMFPITETISLKGGLRLQYGFTDVIVELSEAEFLPKLLNNELSIPAAYAHLDQNRQYSYEPTNALSAGIRLGVLFMLSGE